MSKIRGKAVVAQSGGPTSVINASACGVIQTAFQYPDLFTGVFGALNGILGVLQEELFDFSREDPAEIDRLRRSPGSALGCCRHKIKSLDADRTDYERILAVFRAHDIRYFFYLGGNDSMDTAAKLGQLAREMNYDLVVMGVPKTIDNDLACTDHTPGYGSVARYTAATVMEAGINSASLNTHDTCTVQEIMGRNAGWITAAAGLARRRPEDAPHILLLPEIPFVAQTFVAQVNECLKLYKTCTIACGEGIRTPEGRYLAAVGGEFGQDAFGHVQLGGASNVIRDLVEGQCGARCMVNNAGTAQRVAGHCASQTDVKEAYQAGAAAVKAARRGITGKMVTLVRHEDAGRYRCTTGLADLELVANGEKVLPREFIGPDGISITDAFRRYALPLVQGQAAVDRGPDGLPLYARLERKLLPQRTGR